MLLEAIWLHVLKKSVLPAKDKMSREIILADRYNIVEIVKEEKEIWVLNLLLLLGVAPEELELDYDQDVLFKYGIEVWDHLDNNDVEILQNSILVGKWYAPELIPKYDENNKIYYEIHLDYDSVLDNEFHSAGEDNND